MKKLVAMMGLMTLGLGSAMAQNNGIGVNVLYGSGTSVGFGVKYQRTMGHFALEPTFEYFLTSGGSGLWDASIIARYNFNLGEKFQIYPLAGIGYGGTKYTYPDPYTLKEETEKDGSALIHVGAGAAYKLSDNLDLDFGFKYEIVSNVSQATPFVGITYKF